MPFKKIVLLYFLVVPVFFIIDMIWLGLIARPFYRKFLGAFLSPQVKWSAAIVFYLLFIIGILVFAVLPGLERGSFVYALVYGGLFGFFTYATYDLTNYATLKGWPLTVVFVDILWGIILTGAVSSAGFWLGSWLHLGKPAS